MSVVEAQITSAEQFRLLAEISVRFAQATSENDVVLALALCAAEQFGANKLYLMYFETPLSGPPDEARVVVIWHRGELFNRDPLYKERFSVKAVPLLGRALENPDSPLLVENIQADPQFADSARMLSIAQQAEAVALLPLLASGLWQGLFFAAWDDSHQFHEVERALYKAVAQMAGAAVANRRAYRLQESLRKDSEARASEMEIVARVSAAAAEQLQIDKLLQQAVDLSLFGFDIYQAHIFLLDEDGQHLMLAASAAETGRAMKDRGYKILLERDTSLAAEVGRTRKGIIVNNVNDEEMFVPNPLLPEIRSELAVPLILGNKLLGVLDLQASRTNRFNERILSVMTILAHQLAISIQNANFYAQQVQVAEEMRRVDRLKSQFLANMSHELRTPLNAILNFTHFVMTEVFGPVNREQRENLEKVMSSATHLLALINDILDLSKIEAGMMNLFIEPVDLNALLKSVMATANGLPRHEATVLAAEIEANLPTLSADKRRLRQVLLNLISNALKFTEAGSVTISVRREGQHLLCTVTDTGPGIEPENLEIIFEAFKQTEVGTSKGGTGLGLPISRYLIEAHGGKLWITSQPGQGATFQFTLPIYTQMVV